MLRNVITYADGDRVHDSLMSDWTHGEMPRAFLVKNKLRRSTTVDDNTQANMSSEELDDWISGERPNQKRKNRCSLAESDREKNANPTESRHQILPDVIHADRNGG